MAIASSTLATIGAVGGAVGGVAGAIKGARGQRSQSGTQLGPKSPLQQALEQESQQQFQRQLELIEQQEQGIAGREPLQAAGREAQLALLGGEAFALTPDEQARLQGLRDARVAQARGDIESLLFERLGEVEAGAAQRGVRGQALSELQGQAVRGAADELGRQIRSAETQRAQQELVLPGQRARLQAQLAPGASTFAEQLRQQAIANRTLAQNPAVLQAEQRARLGQSTQTSQSGGGVGSGILGGLAGLAGGARGAINVGQGFNTLFAGDSNSGNDPFSGFRTGRDSVVTGASLDPRIAGLT